MSGKGIRVRHMTIGVCKNRLFSIWNAAMQHLLLSQRHQKAHFAAISNNSVIYDVVDSYDKLMQVVME